MQYSISKNKTYNVDVQYKKSRLQRGGKVGCPMENKNNVSFPDEKSDWDDWAEEERLRDEAYDRAHPEEE